MDLLSLAKSIAARVEAEASRIKVPVSVCVIDAHGNIVLKHRMNGAGAPLTSDDQIVAGVGVSGGSVDQDVAILEAALR